jgi:four helix bundle protein
MKHKFDFQKLDVYQKSLEFRSIAEEVIKKLKGSCFSDQLDRSSSSICLNIAEGSGEFSRKDKARFYRIARRSATESAAIFDILDRGRQIELSLYEKGQNVLLEIVRMLTRMSCNLENATTQKMPSP